MQGQSSAPQHSQLASLAGPAVEHHPRLMGSFAAPVDKIDPRTPLPLNRFGGPVLVGVGYESALSDVVRKAQFEQDGSLDLDRCRANLLLSKQIVAGPVQYSDGILNLFLMGMALLGDIGASWQGL